MSPSISVSLPANVYGRVIDYQDRHMTTLSKAAAVLIKMGFAWEAQTIMQEKAHKSQRDVSEGVVSSAKTALKDAIVEAAK